MTSDLLESDEPGFTQFGSVELTLLLTSHATSETGKTLWECNDCCAIVGPAGLLRHRQWHEELMGR